MATFVIVHGGWGGGWEWTPVARHLRRAGHDVFTPTLTGMGDRSHLRPADPITLATHIDDLVATIEMEDLDDVVLCGASYGGMPATGAADRLPARVRLLVYVDALVPRAAQSALDLLPAAFGAEIRAGLAEHGPHWRVPMPPDLLTALLPPDALPADVRDGYVRRIRDHPAATFADPIELTGAVEGLSRAFVRCTSGALQGTIGDDPIEPCARRARDEGWRYRELATGHDPQVFDPEGIAALLDDLASGPS